MKKLSIVLMLVVGFAMLGAEALEAYHGHRFSVSREGEVRSTRTEARVEAAVPVPTVLALLAVCPSTSENTSSFSLESSKGVELNTFVVGYSSTDLSPPSLYSI